MRQRFGLAERRAEIERRLLPDRRWQGFGHQRAEAFRAHGLQHSGDVAGRWAVVAAREGGRGLGGGGAACGDGVVPDGWSYPAAAWRSRLPDATRGIDTSHTDGM